MACSSAVAPREKRIRQVFATAFAVPGRAFAAQIHLASRAGRVAALEAKPDAGLAAIGLTRGGIGAHVFCDRLYL